MKVNNWYFITALAGLFLILAGAPLFSDGMFLDGLNNATIARNLAEGKGGFWQLHQTDTLPTFYDHPPLSFGILALFYKVFGDSIYVERFYSLLTFIVASILVALIWRNTAEQTYRPLFWLPIFLWVTMPKMSWAYANNMIENTLCIFTLLAVLFVVKSVDANRFIYLSAAGVCLFLGVLTKGPVALFPWSAFLWMWLICKKTSFKRVVSDTLILIAVTLLPFFMIYLFMPQGFESLKTYVDSQVIYSLTKRQTVSSRFYIVHRMIKELTPVLCLTLLIVSLSIKSGLRILRRAISPRFLFFGLLALSAVIPIMVSLKQRTFYILPSLPLFALAFANLLAPSISKLMDYIDANTNRVKRFKLICVIILIAGIIPTVLYFGDLRRQKALLSDVYAIIDVVPAGSTIGICNDMYKSWYLHGYLARNADISLDRYNIPNRKFLLIDETVCKGFNSYLYEEVELNTTTVKLYRYKGHGKK